ncbi:MAG TPA: hypothetical protein VHB79_20200 [Polyangiaceae bacterium]|nr:hypothetical protein [Polyangiaceae bacterium]
MPHEDPQPVERWVHEPEQGGVDAELGELFRALPQESPLEAARLGAVGRRLVRGRASRAPRHARQFLLAAALSLSAASIALAQWGRPLLSALGSPTLAPSARPAAPRPARSGRVATPAVVAPSAVPPVAAPPPQPAMSLTPLAERAPPRDAREVAPGSAAASPVASPGEPESSLTRESALLSHALTALRRDHDAALALRWLDQYQAQFPGGVMALEAATARVDALLLLGRRAAALQLLSGLPLERSGRKTELMLVRAELNAERDCHRALPDFDAVLSGSPAGALAERALFGRAGCQLRLGRTAAGKSDLQSYLTRFPHGRFASQVQARLAEP